MLKKISFIFLVVCMALISGCGQADNQLSDDANKEVNVKQEEEQDKDLIVGGPCSYDAINGSCKITTITQTDDSKKQAEITGGPGYAGYDVKFSFTPSNAAELKGKESMLRKENTLMLTNSWYPGQEYLVKYNIKDNAVFDCELDLINKGTCTPVIYKFDNIDTTDYFETKK